MVAYRSLLMQEMGKDMKLANMLTSGQVDRPADLVGFAAALQNAPIGELFPAGTGPDVLETGAKAALWTDPEGFAKAVKTYQEKATALSAAAQAGDMATAKAAAKAEVSSLLINWNGTKKPTNEHPMKARRSHAAFAYGP